MHTQLPGTTTEEELKRTARVLEIVMMIASAPGRFTRKVLADRFEIGERMITKDLSIIRHGLKLDLRHSQDGYYFEAMPNLPALQYSFSEALALLTAVQTARQVTGAHSPDLAAAIARMESLFPAEFSPLLRQTNYPVPMTAHGRHRQHMLMLLNRAMLGHRKVRMIYETASRDGDVTERAIRPYAIMPYGRSLQLVAYCEFRQSSRMFKLDRIPEARIIDEGYEIPDSFNLEDYLENTWGIMRAEGKPVEDVLLCFEAEAGRWVAEEEWHPSQEVEHLHDGRVLFRLVIAITDEFVKWVLRYGAMVRVEAPDHLRETVRREHLRAADHNR